MIATVKTACSGNIVGNVSCQASALGELRPFRARDKSPCQSRQRLTAAQAWQVSAAAPSGPEGAGDDNR